MVNQSDLWMDDDAICVTCEVAFPAPANLPKEIRSMIMCRPCGDFAWSVVREYVWGKAPVESLDQIRIPKREMMRQTTVDLFARNYNRLTGKAKFKEWFTTHTIGPEKNPEKPAVDTFLEWVRNTYNQHRKAKPMGPKGVTAKLGDIATVTLEKPPASKTEAPPLVEAAPAAAAETNPQSEKDRKALRRKRSETQDAPAVPGTEVEISLKKTPEATAKRTKRKAQSAEEKLKAKIAAEQKALKEKIAKDKAGATK